MRAALFSVLFVTAVAHADAPPAPSKVAEYVEVTVRWTRGAISVEKPARGRYPQPEKPKRWVGRFEARITKAGKPLLAWRFDLPLLADADAGNDGPVAEQLKKSMTTSARVRIPLPDGADAIAIVDTHGGKPVPVALPR